MTFSSFFFFSFPVMSFISCIPFYQLASSKQCEEKASESYLVTIIPETMKQMLA